MVFDPRRWRKGWRKPISGNPGLFASRGLSHGDPGARLQQLHGVHALQLHRVPQGAAGGCDVSPVARARDADIFLGGTSQSFGEKTWRKGGSSNLWTPHGLQAVSDCGKLNSLIGSTERQLNESSGSHFDTGFSTRVIASGQLTTLMMVVFALDVAECL